ncbi:MAG: hypothetical protein A3F74_15270 [Betaproteobacteria bacterium RIFCSPLOWO2_12_FULL_62_58]|nr:MAG: hypothetical protein A3F74_15270 [Betaproteobacteria bacterium RIFCSPLOWO2_12_FULL_62_58]
MNPLFPMQRDQRWLIGVRQVLLHMCITVLAIAIAFSLPAAAQYILYEWWPRVAHDANLLIATEVGLAAALVLLFNISHLAWQDRQKVRAADLAALAYARQQNNWLARWRERRLVKRLPAARDAFIFTLTGFDTFADETSLLRDPLKTAYEIRVMLLNPYARSAEARVNSLPQEITLHSFSREVRASIDYLASLRTMGKKVTLKFYDQQPFWKVVVLGDHVWVQYCHSGFEVKHEPEYVFALNRDHPRRGFFVPFYMYVLEQWGDPRHPEYDFDTGELVCRDRLGKEVKRVGFGAGDGRESPVLLTPQTA